MIANGGCGKIKDILEISKNNCVDEMQFHLFYILTN